MGGGGHNFFDLLDPASVSPWGGETRAYRHIIVPLAAQLTTGLGGLMGEGVWVYAEDNQKWYFWDGSAWQQVGPAGAPAAHATTHEGGGGDEIDLEDLVGYVHATGVIPAESVGATGRRIGQLAGTPRDIYQEGANIWEQDVSGDAFRWFKPGAVKMTLNATRLLLDVLLNLDNATKTIATGLLTVDRSGLTLATAEGGGPNDTIDDFAGVAAGDIFMVSNASGDVITVQDNTNILTADGRDIVLSRAGQDVVCFLYTGVVTLELFRTANLVYHPFNLQFVFPDEDAAAAVLIPRPSFQLQPRAGASRALDFAATANAAGTGTNTIVLESTTTSPFTGSPSWTVRATANLGTSKRATGSTGSWDWDPQTEYLRARMSAVGGTAPKELRAILQGEWRIKEV